MRVILPSLLYNSPHISFSHRCNLRPVRSFVMAKFKTVMNADKFKKAINDLPADPTQSVEFHGFRATKDGDKEYIYIGMYVGTDMTPAFTKDKGTFKSPTLFKGVIHRSPKQPKKKLVLESSGQKSVIKELGKESLKANKLKYAIVAVETGEAEPDLTPQELAEMGLTDADMQDAAQTTTQSTAPQTPPRPTTPPQPTTPPRPAQKPPQQQPAQQQPTATQPTAPQPTAPQRPTMPSPGAQRSPEGRKLMARARMVGAKVHEITEFDKTKAAPFANDLKTVLTNLNGADDNANHATVDTQLKALDGPKLWKAHAEARVGNRRAALHKAMTDRFEVVEKTTFVRGEADRVNAKINPGDQDKVFTTLTKQLAACETNRDANSLKRLEGLCQAFLQGQQGLPSLTPEDQARAKYVQSQLTHARLAQQAIKYQAMGDPSKWDAAQEAQANEMQAVYFFEEGAIHAKEGEYGADPLGSDAGVNGSWWIRRVDPADREGKGGRKFIFKPTDAEDASVAGVQPGSLAAREALAKVFNDELIASAGFDAGVCPTVLAEIDSSKLPDPRGKCAAQPTRLGSMQQLVDPVLGDARTLMKSDPDLFKKVAKENLEQIAIFDLMTGAMDRHPGNVMVAQGPDGSIQLVPIDHGLTMPRKDVLNLNHRRMTSNALLSDAVDPNGHTKQPVSPAIKEGILKIDSAAMVKKMKDARAAMGQRHGGMKDDMSDDNFDLMQRSIEFVQKCCGQDFSVADMVSAMSKYSLDIQSAKPNQLDALVTRIAKEMKEAKAAQAELEELYPRETSVDALEELGWWLMPGGWPVRNWVDENPAEAVRIIKGKIVNPALKTEIDALILKLGGPDKVKALKISLTQKPGTLYRALQKAVKAAEAKPDPTAGKTPDELQAEFARLGGQKALDALLKKYPEIKPNADPAKLQAQQIRELLGEQEMSTLEAKVKQVENDPAWKDYETWVGARPAKPAQKDWRPTQVNAWLENQLETLATWKEFQKEGGIQEVNRLGGLLDAQDKTTAARYLADLRWAKSQEKELKKAAATDDKTVAQTQTQTIQELLRDAQPHYAQLPRVSAVQAFTQRAQSITTGLGGPAAGLTKLHAAAIKLKKEAEEAPAIYTAWEKKLAVLKQAVSLITSKKHPKANEMTTALNDANLAFDQGEAEKGKAACEKLDKLVHEATGPKK